MSKLNRIKNKNVATRSVIEKEFNECKCKTTNDINIPVCICNNLFCSTAIQNGLCKMLQNLSKNKKKVMV